MVFCPSCGNDLVEVADRCPRCGAAVPTLDEEEGGQALAPMDTAVDDGLPAAMLFDEDSEEDLRETMIDSQAPAHLRSVEDADDLRDTDPHPRVIVDRPPPVEEPAAQPGGLKKVITFSELKTDGPLEDQRTGVAPLDFDAFGSGPRPTAPQPEPAVVMRAPPPPTPWKLTAALALLACVTWLGVAAVMVLSYVGVGVVARFAAWLPVYVEVLAALPMAMTLGAVLVFALSPVGRSSAFLWTLLAALPGLGPFLGLWGAIRLIQQSRALGVLLLVFSLCAQGMAVWVMRVHLGWF